MGINFSEVKRLQALARKTSTRNVNSVNNIDDSSDFIGPKAPRKIDDNVDIMEFEETRKKTNALLKDKNYKELSISKKYIDVKSMSESEQKKFFEEKQKQLQKELNACTSKRERAVVAAEFLATSFPKLPYFWGGGHKETAEEMKGISNELGKDKTVTAGGSTDYVEGGTYTYGYDCSGFVSWCLINSGFADITKPGVDTELKAYGQEIISITSEDAVNKVKPGDLATQDGHIGIVIGVDKDEKTITIAHESGSGGGMNITTQSIETGKIVKDDIGTANDINVGNRQISPRVGQDYFTDIVIMDYDS